MHIQLVASKQLPGHVGMCHIAGLLCPRHCRSVKLGCWPTPISVCPVPPAGAGPKPTLYPTQGLEVA